MTENAQQVLVLGLGKTGLACARFLREQGCVVAVADTRQSPPGIGVLTDEFPDMPVFLGDLDLSLLDHVSEIVISPGVDPRIHFVQTAVTKGIPVISEIELFARHVTGKVVGITGTNGKSTVTQLVGLMAQQDGLDVAVGGNFGTPAVELLNGPAKDLYVLELSSFQLEATASLQLEVAVVLNITEDHMDRYDNFADYVDAKKRILVNARHSVLNKDDPILSTWGELAPVNAFYSLIEESCDYSLKTEKDRTWLASANQKLIDVTELKLVGKHNHANMLAALATGNAIGLSIGNMLSTLRRFAGLPHRMQWVAGLDGVIYINDSKATNVGATSAAIEGVAAPIILLAGGVGKEQNFTPLGNVLLQNNIRFVVLFGADAAQIAQVVPSDVEQRMVKSLSEAVRLAATVSQPGDVVLFSPACASFDMFKNFEDRGHAFIDCVQQVMA